MKLYLIIHVIGAAFFVWRGIHMGRRARTPTSIIVGCVILTILIWPVLVMLANGLAMYRHLRNHH